ncbi:MAG: hypothetical protein Q9Q13_08980 [Acidobacteriota bacterium]|nr:hypothetical protein [Acidobacteriota bacterium]
MSGPARLALLGHPVGHSRSARIFTAWSARGGPDLVYQAVDVAPGTSTRRWPGCAPATGGEST